MIALIPVYALWALPTAGWLMLCSAWSNSKPFLWALMLPLFSWVIVAWFGLMNVFHLDAGWFGRNIVARVLTGVFPGSHLTALADSPTWKGLLVTHGFDNVVLLTSGGQLFKEPSLWTGALVGAVMIFAAIRLRRWRDDN